MMAFSFLLPIGRVVVAEGFGYPMKCGFRFGALGFSVAV
jgi:hypothetical protein